MKTWILALIISIVSYFAPIKPLFYVVGFLIATDYVLGMYRAFKLKETITSRKMAGTISKILIYNCAIATVFILEKELLNTGLPLAKVVTTIIALTEVKSLDESFKMVMGFSLWDKLLKVINRGNNVTKDLLDDIAVNEPVGLTHSN